MNNKNKQIKDIQIKNIQIIYDIYEDMTIEYTWENDFLVIMNDMKNIKNKCML